MLTKSFTPEWSSKPVEMETFLKVIDQCKRTGDNDTALVKLMRCGNSEEGKHNFENAGYFLTEAGAILLSSGTADDRVRGEELSSRGAYDYERAALIKFEKKPAEIAELYSLAARGYEKSTAVKDMSDCIRCYSNAAVYYKAATQSREENEEMREAFWMLSAEANLSAVKNIGLMPIITHLDQIRSVELLEKASDAYAEIQDTEKSITCISKAITAIKMAEPQTENDFNLVLKLLSKCEGLYQKEGNIVGVAECIIDQSVYRRVAEM